MSESAINRINEAIAQASMVKGFRRFKVPNYGSGWDFEPKTLSEQIIKHKYLVDAGWKPAKIKGEAVYQSPHTHDWIEFESAVIEQNNVERKQRIAAGAMMDAQKKIDPSKDPVVAAYIREQLAKHGITDTTVAEQIFQEVQAKFF